MALPNLRLLVLDDSTADVRLLQALLQRIETVSAAVTHCVAAEDCLRELGAHEFDCVFLDYMLDDANGLDVLRTIRQKGHDVPIVAFSGCGNEHVAVEALQFGAQDYLVKSDLTPQSIERAIRNSMEKVALSRELAEKQRELKDFVHTAAHDLRAPLRHLACFSESLQADLDGNVSDRVDVAVRHIGSATRRMQRLVESLLAYTRVGRSQAPMEPVELSDVTRGVLLDLRPMIQESGGEVHVGELPTVIGDEVALTQLLQNLISNAITYSGESVPDVRVTAAASSGWCQVSVADQGIGIESQFHEEIFAPFRRLHSPQAYEGSGIGLATCKRIVAQHGGRIWVESELDQGTTIYFTLPLFSAKLRSREESTGSPTAPPVTLDGGGQRSCESGTLA